MKIILAPDSFKGSLSSAALCEHMSAGVRRVYPDADIVRIPIADGGEGTLDSMLTACGGSRYRLQVTGPAGKPVMAQYGVLNDDVTAVIEMAQASGLTLVEPAERNPLTATSYGSGELIRAALDRGCRRFIVGLGGSAVNDAGAGMLQALGAKFLDARGCELPFGGAKLSELHAVDASGIDARLADVAIVAACDVTNPLCGPDGASHVFGPQKGADPLMAQLLDRALNHYADVVLRCRGTDLRGIVGGGAAGGVGAALIGFLGAEMRSGIDVVIEAAGMEQHLHDADMVITGEGRLDAQTLSGKTIAGIARLGAGSGVPVVALCGSLALTPEELSRLGVAAALSIVPGPSTLDEAIAHAPAWVEAQAETICRLWAAARSRP